MRISPKKIHHSEDAHRSASWLELFFDLTLVVPVFTLSHYLAEHMNFIGVISYIVLFMAVLQTWMHHTFFFEQYELPENKMRAITFIKILLLICMTAFIPTALTGGKLGFIVTFVAIRLFATMLWEWGSYSNPEMASMTRLYSRGTILGTILLIVSFWLPLNWMLGFWFGAIILDTLLPALTFTRQGGENLSFSDHLPERFGLFFLILLGESIISLTSGLLDSEDQFFQVMPSAVLALLLVFGLWWMYVENVMEKPFRRDSITHAVIWQEAHMGLFLILPAIGASIIMLIHDLEAVETSVVIFIASAFALALFFLGFIERALQDGECALCQNKKGLSMRGLSLGALILLPIIAANWPAWIILLLLNVIIWTQVVAGETFLTSEHA